MKQSSFTREELLACAAGALFGPGTPKLPADPMLMFDRIAWISDEGGAYGRGEIRAELDIHPQLWFFACHFMDDPVMPGCLGLDALWQLAGFFLAWSGHRGMGRALGVEEVRFTGEVLPSAQRVAYQVDVKRIVTRKLVMISADGSVAVDGQTIYTAKGLRVGVFARGASMSAGGA